MLMAFLTLGTFFYSSYCILTNKAVSRAYMAITHTLYALLILSGGYMLHLLTKAAGQQYWVYGKIALLVVAVISIVIARKSNTKTKAMGAIAMVFLSLIGTVILAFTKPIF